MCDRVVSEQHREEVQSSQQKFLITYIERLDTYNKSVVERIEIFCFKRLVKIIKIEKRNIREC